MSIKRTFTLYDLCVVVDGESEPRKKTFSREAQAEQIKELLAFFGVEATIEKTKRSVEL